MRKPKYTDYGYAEESKFSKDIEENRVSFDDSRYDIDMRLDPLTTMDQIRSDFEEKEKAFLAKEKNEKDRLAHEKFQRKIEEEVTKRLAEIKTTNTPVTNSE